MTHSTQSAPIQLLKATLIHLRLPFSMFLAPVFLFALSESTMPQNALWVFILLHLLLFPASNAFNSYYDKDEGSIGLVEKPPPVSRLLLYVALGMDALAIFLSFMLELGWFFTIYLIVYGLISKAYSHPLIRLKKYPVISLAVVSICQGFYTFVACYKAFSGALSISDSTVFLPAVLCSVNLLAVYPITQVYQHDEDKKHEDMTYSRFVGVNGTFIHAALFLTLSFLGFGYFYVSKGELVKWLLFSVSMIPAIVFFLYWWYRVNRDNREANYHNTMRMNTLAAAGLNFFFILAYLMQQS